jgi:hypothetical protein
MFAVAAAVPPTQPDVYSVRGWCHSQGALQWRQTSPLCTSAATISCKEHSFRLIAEKSDIAVQLYTLK